jgi:hypothetical protein
MFTWIPNAYIKYPRTHKGLLGCGTIGTQEHRREYDVVFLTGASRRGVRSACLFVENDIMRASRNYSRTKAALWKLIDAIFLRRQEEP